MLIDAGSLRATLLRLFPGGERARVDAASRDSDGQSQRLARRPAAARRRHRGPSAIGLWALGIPFFYVLALISAIGEMIPVVGPILSAIPAIAVAATLSSKKVLFVLIFFFLQQQLENHILVPKIMSRQVGVSPVTVIVSLLIGGSCWASSAPSWRCRPPRSSRSSRPSLRRRGRPRPTSQPR